MFKDSETNGRNSLELNGTASTSSNSSNISSNNAQISLATEILVQQSDPQKQLKMINNSQPFPFSQPLTKPYSTSFIYAPHCYNSSIINVTTVNTQVQQSASSSTPPFPTVRFNQNFSVPSTTVPNKPPLSSHSNAHDIDIYAYASSSSSSGGVGGSAIPQIDTSSYSMQTSSSCSTTPNSHYSHAGGGVGVDNLR
jgi:hypothetical protein